MPTASRWFYSAAWREWASRHPYVLIFYFLSPFLRSVLPWRRKFPVFHLFTLGEASFEAKGAASPPCVFMGSQQWFTEQVILSSLSAWADQHFTLLLLLPPSPPLVSEPLLSSQWVTNGFTDIAGLCGWMVPPVLNCRYCNYESHPASSRDYEKSKLPHIVLILTKI